MVARSGLGGRHRGDGSLVPMAAYEIRVIGDPVLKQQAAEVTDIDAKLVRLVDDMVQTMYDAPGLGWPPRRWACRSSCSCGTSPTAPVPTP